MPKASAREIAARPDLFDCIGRRKNNTGGGVWWTRERVLGAMLRFYLDHENYAPLSDHTWHQLQRFTGSSSSPETNPYPAYSQVLRYWPSFREAWRAVELRFGIEVKGLNRYWEEWSAEEDWFILESVGLIHRSEVAQFLKRSPGAVKRRLYDLGVDSRTKAPWGWTINNICHHAPGLSQNTLRDYLFRGEIPYLRGYRSYYIEPSDLVGVIDEIDWAAHPAISPELERAIRRGLMARAVCAIAGVDWRARRPQKFQPIYQRRTQRPTHVAEGDIVAVNESGHFARDLRGRTGNLLKIYWSNVGYSAGLYQKHSSEPQWMARVSFRKARQGYSERKRISYHLPLSALKRADRHEQWINRTLLRERDENGRWTNEGVAA